jgi:hypothetical protein
MEIWELKAALREEHQKSENLGRALAREVRHQMIIRDLARRNHFISAMTTESSKSTCPPRRPCFGKDTDGREYSSNLDSMTCNAATLSLKQRTPSGVAGKFSETCLAAWPTLYLRSISPCSRYLLCCTART